MSGFATPRPVTVTQADPVRLLDVDLVIFDFDGTLYEGTGFVEGHLERLQRYLGQDTPDLAATYTQVRAGEHVLRLGDLFHLPTATILRPSPEPPSDRFGLRIDQVLDLDGAPAQAPEGVVDGHVAFDAPVTYVGDPWQIAAALGRCFGVGETGWREAFAATRQAMNHPDFDLGVPACLPDLLDRFDHVPQRVLVTNTAEALGGDAVAKVGVADRFHEVVFDAKKPAGLSTLIAERSQGLDPTRVLCIGDNYWNDIVPAYQLGAQCVLVDPFGAERVSDGPLHLRSLAEVDQILAGHRSRSVDDRRST